MDFSRTFAGVAENLCVVNFANSFVFEMAAQIFLREMVLRKNYQTGSAHVESVHDAAIGVDATHAVEEIVVAGEAGHTKQAAGFAHDEKIIVLINAGKRHRFGADDQLDGYFTRL